jgi:OOP family OmpA-OmpF porin
MLIIFPKDSAELTEEAMDRLSLVVGRGLLSPGLKDSRFEVAGHTDDNGSNEANMEISRKRAVAVKSYLVENFKIEPSRLQVASYGHTRPVAPNTTPENRRMNRRVEFKRIK